ncbi:MAG: threonine--tRNA ligase [Candidatus Doudnabacteria bacterium]|nr:threonine--tRNA ligase [Candidatus Doudnabacteria bacterium]
MNNKEHLKQEYLNNLRHSFAHLLAAAVIKLYPDTKRTIGPAIENGFYFDFEFSRTITEKDLPKIEKEMRKLLPTWKEFTRYELSAEEAKAEYPGNQFKHELIEEFTKDGQKVSFYRSGEYWDLCKGGHVTNMREEAKQDAFKLTKVAGAYWRGDEKNKMLTRIYGVAFETKEELDAYLNMLAEAEKRDHKVLGPKLDLFMFHHTSPGMPYWLPKGVIIYNELVDFWRKEHKKRNYQEIVSPLLNKKELYITSGHYEHYWPDMFVANMGENEEYGIKAMNCPNAMVVFGSKLRSYKELPLRLSDTDMLHRYERTGTLNGLLRVREFRQDDAHCFISEEMIESEYESIFDITKLFYGIFGLEYKYRLGTRPESFMGDVETWNRAEESLKKILEKSGKDYFIEEGDGAFYGPKVDILMKDALGREWQMGTIQLDFQQPRRFGLEYVAEDGSRKTPVAVHRVIYGSLERFMGLLIEHYAGNFPLWLSPVQFALLPISEKQNHFAEKIKKQLLEHNENLRIEIDERSESIGKKIREATMQKVPYQMILGEKEVEANKLAVRTREGKDLGQMDIDEFIKKITEEIKRKIKM